MPITAAGMQADQQVRGGMVGCRCPAGKIKPVIVRAGQHHPEVVTDFGLDASGQIEGERFFECAARTPGADIVAAVAGVYDDDGIVGDDDRLPGGARGRQTPKNGDAA